MAEITPPSVSFQFLHRDEQQDLPDLVRRLFLSGQTTDVGSHEVHGAGPRGRPELSHGTRRNLRNRRHVDGRQPLLPQIGFGERVTRDDLPTRTVTYSCF